MRKLLSRGWRRIKEITSWGLTEFPKSPRFELYGKFVNRDNTRLTMHLRAGGAEAFKEYSAPYRNRDIPKILWIFWAQGEQEAPALVQRCIASWREKNADWDIRVLTRSTMADYVDLPDLADGLPFRFHANLLRLTLLAKFGGVWTDATTLCHRPLSDWIPLLGGQTGFFTFRGPYHDRWIDNWFIAAHPDNPLIGPWAEGYARYVTRLRKVPSTYFMMIYTLQWRVLKSKALRLEFRASGGLPAVPAFFLQAYLEGNCEAEPFRKALVAGLPLSKLNWRSDLPDEELHARLDALGV